MTKMTLKTLAFAMALFVLAGCGKSKTSANGGPTFTDDRDGKTYATTTIGKQVWMAQNLDYKTENSFCYDDNSANCAKYGRLYTWGAAMDSAATGCGYGEECAVSGRVRGICPTGWHLPTSEEWDALEKAIGEDAGAKLKSKEWDGTDAFGFDALPAGYWYNGDFLDMGSYAHFWTATEHSYIHAYNRSLHSASSLLTWYSSLLYKNHAYSVRCVKD